MEQKIKELIKALKRQGIAGVMGVEPSPDEKMNDWFVIAKLEEILLDENKPPRK